MIERLHYITQSNPKQSHAGLCREACIAGAKWIQLRMKGVSEEEYLEEANRCREITFEYTAKLIINDNMDVALQCGADGVHLGQHDIGTAEARTRVPEGFIIGGTANTVEQIAEHIENGVDYVGVGPYRFTETKKNLSPILGEQGYIAILEDLKSRGMEVPLIAIGGIEIKDIDALMNCGVHGIAVSGLITRAENKTKVVNEITKRLNYANA